MKTPYLSYCNEKIRIERKKGGLLNDSFRWILDNPEFQRWREDERSQLLWIKGDAGNGKTMLMTGMINELQQRVARWDIICQGCSFLLLMLGP
jgi:predicted ATPase